MFTSMSGHSIQHQVSSMEPHQILQELNTSIEYAQVQRHIINHATNKIHRFTSSIKNMRYCTLPRITETTHLSHSQTQITISVICGYFTAAHIHLILYPWVSASVTLCGTIHVNSPFSVYAKRFDALLSLKPPLRCIAS